MRTQQPTSSTSRKGKKEHRDGSAGRARGSGLWGTRRVRVLCWDGLWEDLLVDLHEGMVTLSVEGDFLVDEGG